MAQYTTGELAKLAGVTVRTVQFYDSKDLLKPSDLTEGGRRLYSESDLATLKTICFLKELDFSLNDIAAILYEDDSSHILALLIGDQEVKLQSRIEEDHTRLDRLQELKQQIDYMGDVDISSIGAIATVMGNRKKLRSVHIKMLAVGLLMDVLWIGSLIYGIMSGIWWPFAFGLGIAIILGVLVSAYYYHRVAYICPEDHTIFRPPLREALFAYHTPSMRKLTCSTCGYQGLCLEIYAPDSRPTDDNGTLIWHKPACNDHDGCEGGDHA